MSKDERIPLPDNTFYRPMRRGHLILKGHELDAYYGPFDETTGIGTGIIRVCCGEDKCDDD